MKLFSRTVLAAYLIVLLWLVLFKFSFEPLAVLAGHQTASLNLIPFASGGSMKEVLSNFLVFVPFGLLLAANFRQTSFWHKLSFIFALSLAVEAVQYMLAIGVTDITDLITNTMGGLLGLALYRLSDKYAGHDTRERGIVMGVMILLVVFMLLRVFVLRVRY